MKKGTILLIMAIISFTFYTSNTNAKLTEKVVIQTITKDFIKSHKIQVDGYSYISNMEIAPDKDNLNTEQKSLSNILTNIAKSQIGGDWSPIFYLDKEHNKGYVLEKKLSGANNLYVLSFNDNQSWIITNKIAKKGTDIVELGILESAD
ncbi:hypothetical protein [Siminovitchia fordii]|uniref:Lipoprotein n=1 Tax=Siminovitchia fordii TaxID=254759 RepID=A0ABQ4K815_9BACI|nr:hypothetical protein [Siminovitchia fordii]GIN21170.1 hypothetical protein J1TS3_23040 [Siminovitchia fordii]